MSKILLNKRRGPFKLRPLTSGGQPRVWPGNTTMKFDDDEASALLRYNDVVELRDGQQVRKAPGATPVPAGTGLAGKADLGGTGAAPAAVAAAAAAPDPAPKAKK